MKDTSLDRYYEFSAFQCSRLHLMAIKTPLVASDEDFQFQEILLIWGVLHKVYSHFELITNLWDGN